MPRLNMELTPELKANIEKAAKLLNISVSAWVRLELTNAASRSMPTDVKKSKKQTIAEKDAELLESAKLSKSVDYPLTSDEQRVYDRWLRRATKTLGM